jgi:hypothetical protein
MTDLEQKEKLQQIGLTIGVYIGAGAVRRDDWWAESRQLIIPTLQALTIFALSQWQAFIPIWMEQLEKAKNR